VRFVLEHQRKEGIVIVHCHWFLLIFRFANFGWQENRPIVIGFLGREGNFPKKDRYFACHVRYTFANSS
jgi:hypothetical protein